MIGARALAERCQRLAGLDLPLGADALEPERERAHAVLRGADRPVTGVHRCWTGDSLAWGIAAATYREAVSCFEWACRPARVFGYGCGVIDAHETPRRREITRNTSFHAPGFSLPTAKETPRLHQESRGLSMERATGIEPARSSLGISHRSTPV
jgi:hypothetical protein